ncbi:MAG: hypothetical protein JXR96_02055 [Deltaproteobacteria bacterium]|nr:hypothetical protein [Deltaproteobacteria bacterium]
MRAKSPWMLAVLALASLALFAAPAAAAKKAKKKGPPIVKVEGEVVKQANKKGAITAVQIKTKDGKMVHVVMDRKGKKLGKDLAGKSAEVEGTTFKKKFRKEMREWIRVKTFKEAVAAAPEPDSEPATEPAPEPEGE